MPDPVIIFRDGKLVPFEQIPSQMGYIAKLNATQRDCAAVYCLTPCDEEIISLKCEGFYKGQRGKSFPNALILEVRRLGKDWHIKYFYSKGTLSVCGASNCQEAEQIVTHVCHLLNRANNVVKIVNERREELASAFGWLSAASLGPECDTFTYFSLKDDECVGAGKQRFCCRGRALSIRWPVEVLDQHARAIQQLKHLSSDLTSYPEETPHDTLVNRMRTILNLAPSQEPFAAKSLKCFGIVKYYDMGFTINRYVLADELRRRGYDVTFDNLSGVVVTVHITSEKPFDVNLLQRKKDKSGKETYRFNPGGVVDHHGCVGYMMQDTYEKLMGEILSFRDKIALQ